MWKLKNGFCITVTIGKVMGQFLELVVMRFLWRGMQIGLHRLHHNTDYSLYTLVNLVGLLSVCAQTQIACVSISFFSCLLESRRYF